MSIQDDFARERKEWNERVDDVWTVYASDEEVAHAEEDALLALFVKAVRDDELLDAAGIADLLYDRLLSQNRVKWYA